MEEFRAQDALNMFEDVRVGLQSLDNEEENLIILKSHLAKIKKIREEQIRKDEFITTLKERIAVLENEKVTSNRQSFEIEEILSERISVLEKALRDKNELEHKYSELQIHSETITVYKDSLLANLDAERDKVHEYEGILTAKENEIFAFKEAMQNDKQVIQQLQLLFESFKGELSNKEEVIVSTNRKYQEVVAQLRNELAISRQTIDDMASKLLSSDEARARLDESLVVTRRDVEQARAEGTARRSELEQWKGMYQELETVLLAVKTQLSASQDGFSQEVAALKEDLAVARREAHDHRRDLKRVDQALASIARDTEIITSFEVKQRGKKGGSPLHSSTQRAEILALALAMKRSMASLELDELSDGDGQGQDQKHNNGNGWKRSSRSLNAHIARDIQRITSFISDLVHRLVAQQEGEAELSQQLHQRTEAVSSASSLFARLEEKHANLRAELAASDEAAQRIVARFAVVLAEAGGDLDSPRRARRRDSELVATSDNSYLRDKGRSPPSGGRQQPKAHKETGTAETKAGGGFTSESRAALFEQLSDLVDLAEERTQLVMVMRERLVTQSRRHEQEMHAAAEQRERAMRSQADEHAAEVQRLVGEVQELRRLNDDAHIAIKFTDYESAAEVQRVKDLYNQRLSSGVAELSSENEALSVSLRALREKYRQVVLSLEQVLRYVAPLLNRYDTLCRVYRVLYCNWYRRCAILVEDVQQVAEQCSEVDSQNRSGRGNADDSFHGLDSPTRGTQIVQGKVAITRPRASSRDQRLLRRDQQRQQRIAATDIPAHVRQRRHRRKLSVRIVALFVLAANRFLRFRRQSNVAAGASSSNLFSLSAVLESIGAEEEDHLVDFAACYPAFDLPATEELLRLSPGAVSRALLDAAGLRPDTNSWLAGDADGLLSAFVIPCDSDRHVSLVVPTLCRAELEQIQHTLLDGIERSRRQQAAAQKYQARIESLEEELVTLEALLVEAVSDREANLARIDTLEKERRFGSLTILRDIHNELRHVNGSGGESGGSHDCASGVGSSAEKDAIVSDRSLATKPQPAPSVTYSPASNTFRVRVSGAARQKKAAGYVGDSSSAHRDPLADSIYPTNVEVGQDGEEDDLYSDHEQSYLAEGGGDCECSDYISESSDRHTESPVAAANHDFSRGGGGVYVPTSFTQAAQRPTTVGVAVARDFHPVSALRANQDATRDITSHRHQSKAQLFGTSSLVDSHSPLYGAAYAAGRRSVAGSRLCGISVKLDRDFSKAASTAEGRSRYGNYSSERSSNNEGACASSAANRYATATTSSSSSNSSSSSSTGYHTTSYRATATSNSATAGAAVSDDYHSSARSTGKESSAAGGALDDSVASGGSTDWHREQNNESLHSSSNRHLEENTVDTTGVRGGGGGDGGVRPELSASEVLNTSAQSHGSATSRASRDSEILEIYSDIGRLTGKLERRLRISANNLQDIVAKNRGSP